MKLNQVTVSVTDMNKAIFLYEKLGLELIVKADHYVRFIVPENNATFSIHKSTNFHASGTTVYFETDNVDKKILELKTIGLSIYQEPIMQSWLWYEAYLYHPDGNAICIYQAEDNRLNPPWKIQKKQDIL